MTRTCQAVGRERLYARNLRLAAVAAEVLLIAGFLGIRMPVVRSFEPVGPDFIYLPYDFPTDPVVLPDIPQPRIRPDRVDVNKHQDEVLAELRKLQGVP